MPKNSRKEKLEFKIESCGKTEWNFYKKYHYLNENIVSSSSCYEMKLNNKKVGFLAINKFMHPKVKNMRTISRIVIIPEFQGFGLAEKFMNEISQIYFKNNERIRIITSLKSFIKALNKSNKWKLLRFNRVGSGFGSGLLHNKKNNKSFSFNRITASFEFIGKI